jgi:hypothetical protein
LPGILFDPEDGGIMFLRNVGAPLPGTLLGIRPTLHSHRYQKLYLIIFRTLLIKSAGISVTTSAVVGLVDTDNAVPVNVNTLVYRTSNKIFSVRRTSKKSKNFLTGRRADKNMEVQVI